MTGEQSEPQPEPELKGVDLARRALEEARAAAKANGKAVGQGRKSPRGGVRALRSRRRSWSGAGPDDRDPQPFGTILRQMDGA